MSIEKTASFEKLVHNHTPNLRRTPSAWRKTLQKANSELDFKRYGAAVHWLKQAISEGADAYECTMKMADIYAEAEQWPQAMDAAERAVALGGSSLQSYERLMQIALEAGNRDRAIEACKAVIKISPRHIGAHTVLGTVYMKHGEMEAAMRIASTLVRLAPQDGSYRFHKALLCQHQGEVALAVHEFSEALRLDPEGTYAEDAREALETLDMYQLNQIVTLAMEDIVFRGRLVNEAADAALERGFCLSDTGNQMLFEFARETLPELPRPLRCYRYN